MAPLQLQGETLGQRHRALNRLAEEAVRNNVPFEEIESLPEQSDTERLYKIDVASKYRIVPYIIQNLKSDDDLYVARALKRSTWLVTDPQYSEIINPLYMERELFPLMTSTAVAKTYRFIRLHLKDETRAELFYKHLDGSDRKKEALKWLPSCSVAFIVERTQVEGNNFSLDLFKKLCERTEKVFEIVVKKKINDYGLRRYFDVATFLLHTHPEIILKCFEEMEHYSRPTFKKHATALILSKCPDRVLAKIEKYIRNIDLGEFGKHLGPDGTKDMIVKLAKIEDLEGWFNYNVIRPLVQIMPKDGKFEFMKSVFVDKTAGKDHEEEPDAMLDDCMMRAAPQYKMAQLWSAGGRSVNISNVYQWYRMAPFPTAFNDVKKMIRTESSPDERTEMLKVLITAAGNNMDHIHTLLQHFRERHINEPTKFRLSFLNSLLNSTDPHKYDERSWKLLEEILHSVELYTDEEQNHELYSAVNAVVAYNLLHDKPIPDLIMKKFMDHFITFEKIARKKLDEQSKTKLFNFLRCELQKKLSSKSIKEKDGYNDIISTLNSVLQLLKDWKRDLAEDSDVLKLVQDLIENRPPETDLSNIYNVEKKWRRVLLEHSLDLVQNEAAYMNALKHRPALILQRRPTLDKILKSNEVDLTRILRKLRVYLPENIIAEWLHVYEEKLAACRTERAGYKAVTRGVCVLMERDQFAKMVQTYVPENYKIQWSEDDAALVNLRKYFAQQMYLVRPTLHVDTVLLFAKGDYLQYAVPSLYSVCNRKSPEECRRFLPTLLGGTVSLQKHGIRLAFVKLNPQELTEIFTNTWNTTKNASIRAVIFNLMFDMLHREKSDTKAIELWGLLKTFMEKLTAEENRTVYATVAKVDKVPKIVRAEFCMMSYKLLKSLPVKLNCDGLANRLLSTMGNLMDDMDEDFVTEILLKYVNEVYVQKKIITGGSSSCNDSDEMHLLTKYVICSRSEDIQARRYDKVLKTITECCVQMWNVVYEKSLKPRNTFKDIVGRLVRESKEVFEDLEPKYVNPAAVFRNIQKATSKLSLEENYTFMTGLEIAIAYCDSYAKVSPELAAVTADKMETDEAREEEQKKYTKLVSSKLAPEFAKRCLTLLKEHLQLYFPSIRDVFVETLNTTLFTFIYNNTDMFAPHMLGVFTADPDDVEAYMMAMTLFRLMRYLYYSKDEVKEAFLEIREKFRSNEKREVKIYYNAMIYNEQNIEYLMK